MGRCKDLNDAELVRLLNEGDDSAYTEIYNRYWVILYSHAYRMLRSDDEAMDLVQDVFAELWNNIPSLLPASALQAYLYTVIRNKTLNTLNRRKIEGKYLASLATYMNKGEPVTDNQVIFNEYVKRIEREVANFSPRMRKVFEMSRNLGYSHKQIARELEITDQAVRKTIYRALKILKTQFSAFYTLLLL